MTTTLRRAKPHEFLGPLELCGTVRNQYAAQFGTPWN